MQRAYHLLQDHRHLFFFQAIRRGAHVGFGVLAEGGRIDALDGLRAARPGARCDLGLLVAQHEGFVHAGEGLVLRVFQQAGGAHRQRIANFFEKRLQVLDAAAAGSGASRKRCWISLSSSQCKAKSRRLFSARNWSNMSVAITTRGRNRDAHARKSLGDAARAQQMANECQAARLAAQRAATDAEEAGLRWA